MVRLFFLACWFLHGAASAQTKRYAYTQSKMGSPFTIVFFTDDSLHAPAIAQQSFCVVDSLNAIFSDYLQSSALNALCASAGTDSFVAVSPLLFKIIYDSKNAWQKSGGAFDITSGPLTKLWRAARKEKRFPAPGEIQEARSKTGFDKVIIDTINRRIKLTQKDMQLDLGGIAKGFTAAEVIKYLESKGIASALVDAGGDISCSNAPPGKPGWTIGVNIPEQTDKLLNKTIVLHNKSVATSGDVYQYTLYQGKKYSHIIDPQTGYGVTFQRNVTVIAGDGATADWLATACSILPVKKAKALAKQFGADLLISVLQAQKIKFYTTKGINAYWRKS